MSKLLDCLSSECEKKRNDQEHFGDELYIDAPHGIVVHRDFEILYVDDNYAKLFGFENSHELMQMNSLLDLIDPKEWGRSIRTYQAVMSGEKPPTVHSSRNLNRHKDEMQVLVVDHVIDWEGEPAMQVTIVDLSEQVQAQKRIKESERRYRELVDSSIQGILVHKNFQPLYANKSFLEMFGLEDLSEIEVMMDHIDRRHWPEVTHKHQQLISGKLKQVKSEYQIWGKNREILWVHVLSSHCSWEGQNAVLATVMDVTEQRRLRQALEYKANHDNLTGLMNRHYMSEVLEKKFRKSSVSQEPLYCVLADIDNFKRINDNYGHLSGDKVLKIFSDRCKNGVLHDVEIGRWGGEEFIFLISGLDRKQAIAAVERLRQVVAQEPIQVAGDMVRVTASFGISMLDKMVPDAEMLVANADRALYKAKTKGRNCTVFYQRNSQRQIIQEASPTE